MRKVLAIASIFLFSFQGLASEQLEPQPLTQEEIDAGKEIGVSEDELYQIKDPMTREARDNVQREIEQAAQQLDTLAVKTDKALSILVGRTAYILKKKGFEQDAQQFVSEYNQFYTNAVFYTYLDIVPVELGDHTPLNQWLADWYDKIEAKLQCNTAPVNLCKVFHLIDLKILNYGIPVVFHPAGFKGETWDLQDYGYHFGGHPEEGSNFKYIYHGVAGVAGFWVSYAVCVGATFGAGAIGMICGPIANVVELGVDKYIAPPLSKRIYCKQNEGAVGCEE